MIIIHSLSICFAYKWDREILELNVVWFEPSVYIIECTKGDLKYIAKIHANRDIELGEPRLWHND